MEYNEVADITSGFKERIRRLALFEPLYELDRKKVKDQLDQPIDMKGLGLLSLLFFFEQKIMRNTRAGTKELANFLYALTSHQYTLDMQGCEEIASSIILAFRPTTGKKRSYSFYDWEKSMDEELEYSLLKANNFDSKTNTQYYTLDEDGLELVFATKEFYSEFQLSINQLMLRKQLEKGEFRSALRQINEMRVDVETLNERMMKLRHEIQRSIVSEETFDRYKQLMEDIQARLERENEEFSELRQFVKETKDRLYEKDYHKKEAKTYEFVLEITNQLEEVHYEHSNLLAQSIELKNHTLKAAQESLYYTGVDAFNFDQDINARLIGTPLPLDAMKGLLHPFLHVHQEQSWSPLTLFAEQNIREEREGPVDIGFMELGDQKENDYQETLRKNYGHVMKLILEGLDEGMNELSGILGYIREKEKPLLDQRFFYDFWMILHQRSPLSNEIGEREDDDSNHILDDAYAILGNRILVLVEREETLHVTERFSIQEMDIMLKEGLEDELQ